MRHPDRNKDPRASEIFQSIAFIYEVLSDPQKREIYDTLKRDGIPWQEQYYGQYAHRYGALDHDIRWVLFWFIFTVSVVHFLYRRHRYYLITKQAKTTQRYKNAKLKLQLSTGAKEGKRTNKRSEKKKGKGRVQLVGSEEQAKASIEEEPLIQLRGVSPPGFWDIIAVRLVILPYTIAYFLFCVGRWLIWYKLLGKKMPVVEWKEVVLKRYGLTEEELDAMIERQAQRSHRHRRR